MKKLLLFSVLILGVSCSSNTVNDYKNKIANTARLAVTKELKEAYSDVQIQDVDCNQEAEKLGEKVYDKLVDVLNVKSGQKSLASGLVSQVCGLSVGFLSDYLISRDSDYACLIAIGAVKLEDVGNDLCSAIDL